MELNGFGGSALILVSKSSLEALVGFSQLVAEVRTPAEALPMLLDTALETSQADAAAVFEVVAKTGRLRLVSSPQTPMCLSEFEPEPGVMGADLTAELLRRCPGEFAHAHPIALISDTDLFGVLVLFFKEGTVPGEAQILLTKTLVHLGAIALSKTDQLNKLRKAFSDLETSQEVLARTEKLRALGQMSASISHDLKNLLAPMKLQVEFMKRLTPEDSPIIKYIEGFDRSINRGIETTERLRDFSRQAPDEARVEEADLNKLVQEAVQISGPRIHSGLSVKLELAERLPGVRLRSSDFVSAIVNLIFNAIDAMRGKGEITISSGEAGDGAWVKVADNGPGMPDHIRTKIFEPFFTTKGKEGTGLGAPMVYAFVQRHGGRISVQTQVGKGTEIALWFPAAGHEHLASHGTPGLVTDATRAPPHPLERVR